MFKLGNELSQLKKEYEVIINKLFTQAITEKVSLEALSKTVKDMSSENKNTLLQTIESMIYEQLRAFSLMQYIDMERRKDFGPMGEQRVSISFCRCILEIPNDREVTQFDADRFRRIIEEESKKHPVGQNLTPKIKNPEFDFGCMVVSAVEWRGLNVILKVVGSVLEVLYTYHKGSPSFFLMVAENRTVGGMNIRIAKKEYARSPQDVLSIAATQGDAKIDIRMESCEVIFFNKWQKFYDQSKAEMKRALKHPNSAIREGIKHQALLLYGMKNTTQVKEMRQQFLDDMVDGIIWHELGHFITETVLENGLDKTLYALTGGLGRGEYFLKAVREAFADWAPRAGEKQGAISRFCEIAKTDKARAKRLAYVYLSDNWFADEQEDFLPFYTDILTSLMIAYIDRQGDIQFERLEADVPKIHAFLVKMYNHFAQKLLDLLSQQQYKVGIHVLSFDQLKKETLKQYKGGPMDRPAEELMRGSHFWTNIFAYARKFSEGFEQKLDSYFKQEGQSFNLKLLAILTKNNEAQFNNSLREYIYVRFREMRLLNDPVSIDISATVAAACAAMKMPEPVVAKVQEKFRKIIDGEPHDISISYEGEKDPFIATIQEMMLKSGYGEIQAAMTVGELYSPEDTPEKRKQYIKEELENIRDQLESEMYLEVEVLKVNEGFNVKPMVEELLEAITFFDGKRLLEKIRSVQYVGLRSEALFEVLIPLKRGFMDWNTSQAVWRINQDIRPDEFIMQWTIDKEFIEALVETYQ